MPVSVIVGTIGDFMIHFGDLHGDGILVSTVVAGVTAAGATEAGVMAAFMEMVAVLAGLMVGMETLMFIMITEEVIHTMDLDMVIEVPMWLEMDEV
jgi:hypothetical protein